VTTADPPTSPKPPLTLADLDALGVESLKGVGPKRADALRKAGVDTVLDLLRYYPRRYVDRTREARIRDLRPGEEGMVLGTVKRVESRRIRGNRTMVTVTVADTSGTLGVTFFNQPWRAKQLYEGLPVVLFGKVDTFRGNLQMASPIVDLIGDQTGKIVSIYPASEKVKIGSTDVTRWVAEALRRAAPRTLADPLPERVKVENAFVDRHRAMFDSINPNRWPRWLPLGDGWCSTSSSRFSSNWCTSSGTEKRPRSELNMPRPACSPVSCSTPSVFHSPERRIA